MKETAICFEKRGKKMKLTSAEASKMIRQIKDDMALLSTQEKNGCRFVAATIENVEEVRPKYSYAETAAKMDEYERRIRAIKHALNLFNANTKPDGVDMTIDEILVYLPQLSERLRRLAVMLTAPEKERVEDSGRTSIIEYNYANYDYDAVRSDYDKLQALKSRLLTALDVANNTVSFEVEI